MRTKRPRHLPSTGVTADRIYLHHEHRRRESPSVLDSFKRKQPLQSHEVVPSLTPPMSKRPTQPHEVGKRRREISKTEIITVTREKDEGLPSSNSLELIRCSPRKQKKWKRKKSASGFEGRRWAFSSCDVSRYKYKMVVVSYNILGVENASKHPDLYSEVPHKFLEWECRKRLILQEINLYDPNIVCFQEVDRFNDIDFLLQKDGFKGIHKARTGEAMDGCAIFWKDKQYTLLHQEDIEFQRFGLRDNVAQLCVLKVNQNLSTSNVNARTSLHLSPRCLIVGNIHVLFNPNRGDIKLGQIRLFLEKAYRLSQDWGRIPIVLAGDLNSMPQSAIYQFLASSKLDIQLYDRREISRHVDRPVQKGDLRYQNEGVSRPMIFRWSNEEIKLATGSEEVTCLQHHLKLCSAYHGVPGSSGMRDSMGEPLATSFHSKFMGTVDYIWHTEELVPVRVLETLPMNTLRKIGGLPSKEWGSDHLALVCELAFTDDTTERD